MSGMAHRRLSPVFQPSTKLTVHSELSGLLVVKLGRKSSPDPRNPGKSVDDQMTQIDIQCDRVGLVERARFEEDAQGASQWSKKLERKKFEEAMAIIETEEVAVFAVWSLSRSARRLMVHGRMVETLQRTNTLIMVEGRLYDTSEPQDRLALGFQALMDENVVAIGRKDSMRGLDSAAKKGRPHGPHIYGYRRVYDEHTRALVRVETVPEEADIIKEVADRLLDGESMHGIAKDLTERKVPRPRGAKAWYPQEVKDLVTNVTYAGKRSHTLWRTDDRRIYEAMWPAILGDDLFERVGAIVAARETAATWSKHAKYMLTGCILCGSCDRPLYGNRQGGMRNKTTERSEWPMVYHCARCRKSRNMAKVDTVVRDTVQEWLSDPETVARFASARDEVDPQLEKDRAALVHARSELEAAYTSRLSARGLAAMEEQWLPEIERLETVVAVAEVNNSRSSGWQDVAASRLAPIIPEDTGEARDFLRRLIRVRILPAGRGVRFHPDQVEIVPVM